MINSWLKNKSIVYKTWLLITLGLISTASIFLIARQEILHTMMVVELNEHGNELRQKSARLIAVIQSLTNDIRYLSISRPIRELNRQLSSPSAEFDALRLQITDDFVAQIKSKRHYHQLRIITADNGGKEIIRVTRALDGSIIIAGKEELQHKGDSPYFRATAHLHNGDVYLSPIELNREKGKVEMPHRPVIRAAIPLHDKSGKVSAIIVCNMDFGEILNWLTDSHGDGYDYITNIHGDYLTHQNRRKTFGFEFNTPYRFQDDHPEMAELIRNRSLGTENRTFEYLNGNFGSAAIRTRFDSRTTANDLLMIRIVPYETIQDEAEAAISQTKWLILLLFLLGALLARWFTQMLVSPIRMLAKAADSIAIGEAKKIPDFGFGGEVGDLADDFNAVLEKLDLQQAELADSLNWNETIMNSAADAIISVDEEGIIHSFNDSAQQMFGYKSIEAIGQNINKLMPTMFHEEHGKLVENYRGTETRKIFGKTREVVGERKDGEVFPVEINVTVAHLESKIRFIAILRDISERKEAEKAILQSEAGLKEAQRLANLGSWDWNIQENQLFWSDEVYRIFGLSPQGFDATYDAFLNVVHPDDRQLVTDAINSAVDNREPYDIKHRVCLPDGTVRMVNERGKVSFAADGKPLSMVGTVHDITSQHKLEEILRQSEARYRGVVETSPYPIVVHNREKLIYANKAALNFLGTDDSASVIGKDFTQFIHQDFRENADEKIKHLLRSHSNDSEHEYLAYRLNGEEAKIRLTSITVQYDGEPAALTQFRDITEEERAKEELHREHNLNQQLLLAIPSILIGVDRDGTVALWNHAAALTFGTEKADALGIHFSELKIQWSWNTIDHGIAESRAAGTSRVDNVTFQRPDGSEGILGLTIRTIYDDGIDSGFLLLGSDISERLKLEGQLQLSQKMEAVGELAAGIAHEINTPLQYVGDNIRFLKDSFNDMHELCEHYHKLIDHCEESSFAPDMIETLKKADEEADIEFIMEEIPSAIEQSLDGVSKASNIVSAMKEFSHPGQKEKTLGDINKILESTATVARNEWKYIAELKLELDESLPPIRCLPEINQVFLNMIVNAAHAIEEKLGENSSEQGLITIATSQTETHAVIKISDTGNGIPEEHLNKIFEPFFTTKEVGKGTGQGLAISHNIIVEQHQGSLEIESTVGEGTTFIIRLPMLYNGEEA